MALISFNLKRIKIFFIKTSVKYDCNFIQANTVFIQNEMYGISYSTKRYLRVLDKNTHVKVNQIENTWVLRIQLWFLIRKEIAPVVLGIGKSERKDNWNYGKY